jgi:RNA polymerase sigma-70 factor (ECF subfamily)
LASRIAVVDPPAATTPGPGEGGDADLEAAMATLRGDERELLRLWAWEQLTPAEIGTVLGVSANAVSIRLLRAKEKLKKSLETRKDELAAGHEETNGGRRT